MYVISTRRGRPVKDTAWSLLVNQSLPFLENDEDENTILLNKLSEKIPRGCFKTWKSEKVWRCHFYIGGSQRVLGRGTLYQCAKLYDYALVLFDKHRVRKAITYYNFSKADAESEILNEPAIRRYFESLEGYLLSAKLLKTEEEAQAEKEIQDDTTKEKQRVNARKRTIAGTIETWMQELRQQTIEIANDQEATLDEIKKRLTAIETHLKIVP